MMDDAVWAEKLLSIRIVLYKEECQSVMSVVNYYAAI